MCKKKLDSIHTHTHTHTINMIMMDGEGGWLWLDGEGGLCTLDDKFDTGLDASFCPCLEFDEVLQSHCCFNLHR